MPKPLERRLRNREHDANRKAAQPWRAWYGTSRWKALRAYQLLKQPLCARCEAKGVIRVATVAHHKQAHKGNEKLFWDAGNLASSCAPCHDATEQRIEARGHEIGCDLRGRPVASDHPWNTKPSP